MCYLQLVFRVSQLDPDTEGSCSKSRLTNCNCFDMKIKFLGSYPAPYFVNVTADCSKCEYVFEEPTQKVYSNMLDIKFFDCSNSEITSVTTHLKKELIYHSGDRVEIFFQQTLNERLAILHEKTELQKYIRARETTKKFLIPREFFESVANQTVRIENNTMQYPHEDLFKNDQHAVGISLINNSIIRLPDKFLHSLSHLMGLDLSFNEITAIPEYVFINSTALKFLWLSHNKIVKASM